MMKKFILDQSRKLFNQDGLSNVTIRQIAIGLNMSSGNLNYHFKTRGDVVGGVFEDLMIIEEKFMQLYITTKLDEGQLKRLMKAHAKAMFDYRFFWLDFVQVGRENIKVQKKVDELMQNRIAVLDFEWANYLNQFLYIMATSNMKFTPKSLDAHFNKIEDKVFA
jgi:AcrR family transcriptional regulator